MMASQINATHSSAQKHAIGDSGGNSNQNIYLTFEEVAQKQPSKTAVVIPIIHHQREVLSYQYYSFDDLLLSIRKYANGFLSAGLKPDMKALVFIKPGLELISIALIFPRFGGHRVTRQRPLLRTRLGSDSRGSSGAAADYRTPRYTRRCPVSPRSASRTAAGTRAHASTSRRSFRHRHCPSNCLCDSCWE